MEVARRLNMNQPRYSRYEMNGRYTINSRVPSERERQMLSNVIAAIFNG